MPFYRDTWVEIDLDCIQENVANMLKLLPDGVDMIAVVKANAYGHGEVQVAKTVLEAGASYLAVAMLDEGLLLRKHGIEAPILVLGASRPEDVNVAAKNHLTLTVFQEQWVQEAKKFLEKDLSLSFHLKIDTGMGRIGLRTEEELRRIESVIESDPRFQLEGVYTHFATADEKDLTFFKKQYDRFQKMISLLKAKPKMIHASNSAASLRKLGSFFNAIRFGVSMYGLSPSPQIKEELPFTLKEAFSLRTKVSHVKKISAGDSVSYGATYTAAEDEWIATIPIGYADGWLRKLQGQEVLIDGARAKIVGRICMDQCMIKIPHKVEIGTTVTLIGQDGEDRISIDDIAKRLETINYEIPCLISSRVPRVYKKGGAVYEVMNFILQS